MQVGREEFNPKQGGCRESGRSMTIGFRGREAVILTKKQRGRGASTPPVSTVYIM